ncbi:hypothetical protein NQZ68_002843 [Dissostichus eleginoides]|nr:hypothetical protein NQZ68_002843 [Dissostichus eleginoides]
MAPELQRGVALGHRAIKSDEIIWQWWRSTVETLVTPGAGSPLWAGDGPEKGSVLNERAHGCGTISSVWHSRRLGVSRHTLVCATCLTPDSVMTQSALP